VRSSWQSSGVAALALALAALAGVPAAAHRLDEYLQAARIAIDPDRVHIELDLTPGVAVARGILADLDADHDGSFTAGEARAYAARVQREIRVELDGQPLTLALTDSRAPAADAILRGEGVIRLQLTAAVPLLAGGPHQLFYRNGHRSDVGAYLANALVPASDRVAVLAQRRDVAQQELVIEYSLRDSASMHAPSWLIAVAGIVVTAILFARFRSLKFEV
jgi:hypothetical protein